MITRILETFCSTLTPEQARDLNEMLAWIACAPEPLRLSELDGILALASPAGDSVLDLEGRLRTNFGSLFSLKRKDNLTTDDLIGLHQRGITGISDLDLDLDLENTDVDFQSDLETTEVTLYHSAIGEFLQSKSQGKISVGPGHPVVGVDINHARSHVLDTCLRFLCRDVPYRQFEGSCIESYIRRTWSSHLDSLDWSTCQRHVKQDIA